MFAEVLLNRRRTVPEERLVMGIGKGHEDDRAMAVFLARALEEAIGTKAEDLGRDLRDNPE